MRARLMSLAALSLVSLPLACGPGEASDFCATALEQNAACLASTAAEDCEALNDECPGRVLIAESCPVQFSCPPPGQE